MKRIRIAALCLALCLPLGLAGCGDGDVAPSSLLSSASNTPSSSRTPASSAETVASVPVSSTDVSDTVPSDEPSSTFSSSAFFSSVLTSLAGVSSAGISSAATSSVVADPLAGRTLVWSDEFDGTSLNTAKWTIGSAMTTGGTQKNDSAHVAVRDGNLILTSTYSWWTGCQTPPAIMTRGKMSFTYGYIEMRAIVPFRHGAWPSFWMKSEIKNAGWMGEFDILEVFSNSRYVECNLHKWANSTGGAHSQLNPTPRGYTFPTTAKPWEEYHTYGMEWTPDTVSFLVDGQVYCRANISATDSPYRSWGSGSGLSGMGGFHDTAYLILNNSIITDQNYQSDWMPESWKASTDDYPYVYSVDYVRLYQKSGEILNTSLS